MATDVRALSVFGSDTDAHFREWGQAISNALQAVGLVKCSAIEVVGQINWATVTRPTTGDVVQGYECFKFADALQATSPVFVRITYGASNIAGVGGANWPGLTVTVINGAIDASGNPAGSAPNTANQEFGMSNWYGAALANGIMTSGSSSRVAQKWMNGQLGGSYGVAWGVERIKDANGNDTADGIIFQWQAPSVYNRVQSWFLASGANTAPGCGVAVLMNNGDNAVQSRVNYTRAPLVFPAGRVATAPNRSGIFGANTAVWPYLVPSGRGYENPGMNFVGVWNVDIAPDAQFDAQFYGMAHHYRAFGPGGDLIPGSGWFDDGTVAAALVLQSAMSGAMRWE